MADKKLSEMTEAEILQANLLDNLQALQAANPENLEGAAWGALNALENISALEKLGYVVAPKLKADLQDASDRLSRWRGAEIGNVYPEQWILDWMILKGLGKLGAVGAGVLGKLGGRVLGTFGEWAGKLVGGTGVFIGVPAVAQLAGVNIEGIGYLAPFSMSALAAAQSFAGNRPFGDEFVRHLQRLFLPSELQGAAPITSSADILGNVGLHTGVGPLDWMLELGVDMAIMIAAGAGSQLARAKAPIVAAGLAKMAPEVRVQFEKWVNEQIVPAVRRAEALGVRGLSVKPLGPRESLFKRMWGGVELPRPETPGGKVVPPDIGKRVEDILGKSMMGEPTADVVRVARHVVDYWGRQAPGARVEWYADMRHKFATLFGIVKGRRQLAGEVVTVEDFDRSLKEAIRGTMVEPGAPTIAAPVTVPALPFKVVKRVTPAMETQLKRLGWSGTDIEGMTPQRASEIIGSREVKVTPEGELDDAVRNLQNVGARFRKAQSDLRAGKVTNDEFNKVWKEMEDAGKRREAAQDAVDIARQAPVSVPAPSPDLPKLADILGVPSAAELEVAGYTKGAFPRELGARARETDLRAWNWVSGKADRAALGDKALPRARAWYDFFMKTLLRDYPAAKSAEPGLTVPKYLERLVGAVKPNAVDNAMDAADMEIYGKVQRVREQATPEPTVEKIAAELPLWKSWEKPKTPLPGIPVVRRTGKAPKIEPARAGTLGVFRAPRGGRVTGLGGPELEPMFGSARATPAQVEGLRAKLNASPAGRKILLGLSVAGTVMSVDVLTIWLSSDNLMTGFGYTAQMIMQQVKSGSISPEEGLRQIDELERRKNETASFIRTSTYLNPLLWLFGKQYRQNIAQTEQRLAIARHEIGLAIMPEEFEVEVVRVIDGDTVEVALDAVDLKTGKRVRLPVAKWGDQGVSIRTAGVNAPEMGAEWGTKPTKKGKLVESIFPKKDYMPPQYADKAKELLAPLVGKRIKVYVDKADLKDDNGRIVGRIEFGGKDMGFELLKAGLGQAWNYKPNKQVDVAKYEKETADAVREKRGGWKLDFPALKGKTAGKYQPTQGVSGRVMPSVPAFDPKHPMGEYK